MSKLVTPGEIAPDFELTDVNDKVVTLSGFRGSQSVVLYFLRGFM